MALVLLVSAVLMIRTFAALRNVEPGFADAQHVQTMHIWIPDLLISDPQTVTHVQNNIVDKLAAIPGVTSVGFAGAVPMENIDPNWDEIRVEGKSYAGGEPPLRLFNFVSPAYFNTMGTRLVAGRDFTWSDLYDLRPRVIVSENFARESWGSASAAVGKRLRQFDEHRPGKRSSVSSKTCAYMASTKRPRPSSIGRRCSTIRTHRSRPLMRRASSRSRFAATVPEPKASSSRCNKRSGQ